MSDARTRVPLLVFAAVFWTGISFFALAPVQAHSAPFRIAQAATEDEALGDGPVADELLKIHSRGLPVNINNVLVVFSASWCHPCHTLTSFFTDPAMRPFFDRNFVTLVLYDGEREEDTLHHDSVGAHELRDTFHAREAGLPYFAMLDRSGKVIVDSVRPVYGRRNEQANIGYPGGSSGKDWFMEMMHRAAPSLTPNERQTIERWLTQHGGDGTQTQG